MRHTSDIHITASQLRLAMNTMHEIECVLVPILQNETLEENVRQNLDRLLDHLRSNVQEMYSFHHHKLLEKKRDLIDEIFLLPVHQSPLLMRQEEECCELKLESSDEEDATVDVKSSSSPSIQSTIHHSYRTKSTNKHSSNHQQESIDADFQKQQQLLLESELSTLASHLKSSTLAMNATLSSQTRELEEFETIAQNNLQEVSSTAKAVEHRLIQKKGWKKRLGTVSLICVLVGMWIVCFMVIRTVPKRRIDYREFKLPSFSWLYYQSDEQSVRYDDSLDDEYQEEEDEITDEMYAEQERRQKEMLRQLQEEERRKWNEEREEQWRKTGCEILPDGTQHCPGEEKDYYSNVDSSDRRAQEHAAERKRSRIEENMENAQIVNAVDVDEAAERAAAEEERQREAADRLRLEEKRAVEEAKRRMQEAERHRKMEEEARAEAERQARLLRDAEEALVAQKRREQEEAERLQIEEQARLQKEAEAQAAAADEREAIEEALIQKRLQEAEEQRKLELESRAAAQELANTEREANEKQKQEEAQAAAIRQRKERARIQKDKEAQAAAQRAARRHRKEEADARSAAEDRGRIQQDAEARASAEREALADQERLKQERMHATERVRKTALEEAQAAMQHARRLNIEDNEILPSDVRNVASLGKNDLLAYYIAEHPGMVDASDGSGWRPIHEAARGGNLAGVQLLIDSGSDLSARTGRGGSGGTALWWAVQRYGEESDIVRLLRSYDAPEDGPEL
ncbi:hypothetical protein ACHAWO_001875 [Cyclotella atomus]|uniref:t-SNARE coiled-coil homology domain-containing protein n=1 Tax=Cyclotella atomus TaxID=382360 RepID=A0ABD3N5U5_9STRA